MHKLFIEWCQTNNINVMKNDEMFFISERLLIKPDYRLIGNIFIDLIRPEEISDAYLAGCEVFRHSHGSLIVIPTDAIPELNTVTKEQFAARFDIQLV